MRVTGILSLLLVASTAAANTLFSSTVLDSWDANDLKNYLKDNSIPFDEKKATIEEIKSLSKKQWELQNTLNKPKQSTQSNQWFDVDSIKQKVFSLYSGKPSTTTNTGVNKVSQSYQNIKDWVFTSWSTDELKKLLDTAQVKYTPEAKRYDLIKTAQDNYKSIAKSFKASGYYPGDWLYSTWDKKSLKKWLKENNIDYSSLKDSKEDLVKKVRQHAYEVSKYNEDQRDSILETLDLQDKSLFDKAGEIKDDIFNSWTASQLYKWLKTHEIEFEDSLKNNQRELSALAQKNKDQFKSDVDYWVQKASKTVSPFLSKTSEKADNVINDTFLVGVESWSRDRLKAFLDARGVSIPYFATKYELVELVKENKFKPIQNFNSDYFFQGWSKDQIQKWTEEQKGSVSKSSQELLTKANDLYKDFVSGLDFYASKITGAVGDAASQVHSSASGAVESLTNSATKQTGSAKDAFFNYWSDVELREYLASFGIHNAKNYKHEQLLDLAKKNTRWFVSGASYDQSTLSSLKLNTANFWNYLVYHLKNWYNYVYYAIFKN